MEEFRKLWQEAYENPEKFWNERAEEAMEECF